MNKAAYIIKRVDNAFKRIGGMSKTVLLRTVTMTGGFPSIGRPGTRTSTDKTPNPQPVYRQLGNHIAMELSTAGKQYSANDYRIIFSPNAVKVTDLEDTNVCIILRDALGAEEILRIINVNSQSFQGQDVVIEVIARSTAL